MSSPFADPAKKPPLDRKFLSLSLEELEFLKAQTLIESEDALKEHIFVVQKKAYEEVCSTTGFWDLGHELFKTTPTTYPVAFIAGDVFNSSLIAPRALSNEVPQTPRSSLKTLVSLTPLQGHVSVIHASSFFHLFNEGRQHELAQRLATLLSPIPGSMLFGSHIGKPEKGIVQGAAGEPSLFSHSPESWRDLWDGQVFEKGTVKVEAYLKQVEKPDMKSTEPFYLLVWSVTRLY
ncbi:hypothetical protein C0995_016549 [Termitomyces sp. Mi166|nr:hypothetical protein C0995_016549 [Termitomyces sp. Mi166\